MDPRHRVYYLVNLNQNRKLGGWWSKGWDSRGSIYTRNLFRLKGAITSLKERYIPYDYHSTENYQVMISCKKEEESTLIKILRKSRGVNYTKIDSMNKEKIMAFARKCDRCGKYYEKNHEKCKDGTVAVGICFIDVNDASIDDKDLCDECIAKFKRFMAGCELKEE